MYKDKVEISVTLFFNEGLCDDEIDDVVSQMDYNFNHQWIEDTRINGIIDQTVI